MNITQMLPMLLLSYGIPLVLLPTLGGSLVFAGFRIARLPKIAYWHCWKVYLAGCCYGFLMMVVLRFGLHHLSQNPPGGSPLWVGAFCGTQMLLVPLLLKKYSPRALGATILAVLLTNLIALGLVWGLKG